MTPFLLALLCVLPFIVVSTVQLQYHRYHAITIWRTTLWSLGALLFVVVCLLVILPTIAGYILDAVYP